MTDHILSRGENYTGSLIKIAELLLLLDGRDPDIISYVTETAQVLQIMSSSEYISSISIYGGQRLNDSELVAKRYAVLVTLLATIPDSSGI
mgnify:CR=1 FL=1